MMNDTCTRLESKSISGSKRDMYNTTQIIGYNSPGSNRVNKTMQSVQESSFRLFALVLDPTPTRHVIKGH